MNARTSGTLVAVGIAIGLITVNVSGQGADTVEKHVAAAKAAAGDKFAGMFKQLCEDRTARIGKPPEPPAQAAGGAGRRTGPPPRENWHAEPVKVFDNLYWLGEKEHSAWALKTSDGIILMDVMYDYTLQDEVVDGAKKMGLDPSTIKYAIMGHWHGDHAAGAKGLKELYGTKIIMGPADWDNMEKQAPAYKMPKDVAATDGGKVTLGDTTVTTYVTPAHTAGTVSSIFTVYDRGTKHVVAYWGGTRYNWIGATQRGTGEYTGKPESFWFTQYANTADRFKEIAAKAGADVYMSNHTDFDLSKEALPKYATRKAGDPNPMVVGKEWVQRSMTMAAECARAGAIIAKKAGM